MATAPPRDILASLQARLPDIALQTDDLELFTTDIYYVAEHPPLAVAAPRTAAEICKIVAAVRDLGLSLTTRGAGLSYSAGYLPTNARTLVIDMRGLDRIIAINNQDRHVTVEAGVTWAALRDALKPHGLTTPFWGTFSGRHATIGASLAQGAKFFGSASRGSSAESVLGLKVVTGRGDLVTTGSAASNVETSPFFRNYGPDLTGMFLGDCGAFGIKVEATLQLVPIAGAVAACSYFFEDAATQLGAMGRIGSELLASECLGIDSFSARARMEGGGLLHDLKTLGGIVAGSGSILGGLRDAAQIALSGRGFVQNDGFLMNCVVEGRDSADAQSRLRRVRLIAREAGGRPLPASIPKVMHALPFPPMNGLLTPSAKRMNWLHTVVPNSGGGACYAATEGVFERHRAAMKENGVDRGYLLSTHGPSGVGVETLIRWSDEAYPIHSAYLSPAEKARLRLRPGNAAAAALVKTISGEILDAWRQIGGVHLQIGRKYPYFETRLPQTAELLGDFKRMVDPDGILHPGNLFGPTA